MTNEPVEITINKINANDTAIRLNGAVFEITGIFADEITAETREFTTASDGALVGISNISAQLKSGQVYTLTEKTAPSGYELIEGTLTFAVNGDGTITPQGNIPAGYSIEQGNVSIVAADSPIDLAFFKKDLGNNNELAGAEFTLSGTFADNAIYETSQQTIGITPAGTAMPNRFKARVFQQYDIAKQTEWCRKVLPRLRWTDRRINRETPFRPFILHRQENKSRDMAPLVCVGLEGN